MLRIRQHRACDNGGFWQMHVWQHRTLSHQHMATSYNVQGSTMVTHVTLADFEEQFVLNNDMKIRCCHTWDVGGFQDGKLVWKSAYITHVTLADFGMGTCDTMYPEQVYVMATSYNVDVVTFVGFILWSQAGVKYSLCKKMYTEKYWMTLCINEWVSYK